MTAGALGVMVTLTGCTQSPAGHDGRLVKASGVARVALVCPPDLWMETKPESLSHNKVKAKVEEITSGPYAGRGLVRVTMSGTSLVDYLKELDENAHPAVWDYDNTPASRRMYNAIAPKIDKIKAATGPDDPEPLIVIDDTIPDKS